MRLLKLEAHYFRGFQAESTVYFDDSDLVVLYGENGSGKTSLAEAIEWLLYGSTHRQEIASVDKTEQREALVNVKCPADENPYVEGVFELDGGVPVTLRRELYTDGTDEWSELHISEPEKDIPSIPLSEEGRHYNPVIVQENLQRIVNSSGQQRRERMSQMLGLHDLLRLEKGFRYADRVLLDNLPEDVADLRRGFLRLKRRLDSAEDLDDLTQRWDQESVSYPSDWKRLVHYCCQVCGVEEVSAEEARTKLRQLEDDAVKQAFDYTPYEPQEDVGDLTERFEKAVESLREDLGEVVTKAGEVYTARAALLKETGEALSSSKRDFLRTGLELAPDLEQVKEPAECPFCGERTLRSSRVTNIEEHLEQCKAVDSREEELETAVEGAADRLDGILRRVERLIPDAFDERARDSLVEVLPNKRDLIESFEEAVDNLRDQHDTLKNVLENTKDEIQDLPQDIADVTTAEEITDLTGDPLASVSSSLTALKNAHDTYEERFELLRTALIEETTSDDRLQSLKTVELALSSEDEVRIAARVNGIHDNLKDCRNAVVEYREEEEERRLEAKGKDITKWFERLYPTDPDIIEFSRADPRGQVLRLLASILGEERHAATHFSQSQATCLGLAHHIMSSVDDQCPFQFIVFDDPIQSFDSEHRDAFHSVILEKLLDEHAKQVIVLTHIESFAENIYYGNLSRRSPAYYTVTKYDHEGVSFAKESQLHKQRQKIRRLLKGDSEERDSASQEFSPFVEKLAKAVYRSVTEEPIPPTHRAASGPDLIDLFESIPQVSEEHMDQLRANWNFGTKPRHDDPEQSRIPERDELARRIEQLETIGRKHGVLE